MNCDTGCDAKSNTSESWARSGFNSVEIHYEHVLYKSQNRVGIALHCFVPAIFQVVVTVGATARWCSGKAVTGTFRSRQDATRAHHWRKEGILTHSVSHGSNKRDEKQDRLNWITHTSLFVGMSKILCESCSCCVSVMCHRLLCLLMTLKAHKRVPPFVSTTKTTIALYVLQRIRLNAFIIESRRKLSSAALRYCRLGTSFYTS